jgi:hypothetical protein
MPNSFLPCDFSPQLIITAVAQNFCLLCAEINRSLGGFGLGTLLFLHRKAHSVEIKNARPALAEDESKSNSTAPTTPVWQPIQAFLIFRISGGLLFRHSHQHRFGTG